VAVAAGGGHSLAVSSDGGVFAWGLDSSCQLGNGQNQNALAPVSVRVGFPVLRAAAGSDFSFALGR
jgi:alpha-tubulin suppressor-like RCC1 family protein